MGLKAIWFIINIFFVISFVVTLFVQRAVTMAALEQSNPQKVSRFKSIRNICIAVTIILFIAMSVAFLSDMRVNG